MLLRLSKNWVVDFFVSRGWLVKGRRLRQRPSSWGMLSMIPAECLEDRTLLSTITVTSLADTANPNNGVTLREAIQAANTHSSVNGSVAGEANTMNIIVFSPGLTGTLTLAQGQLTISSSMEIDGLGAGSTIIDAQHNSRIFDITSAAGDVTLNDLRLENGKMSGSNDSGGAIESSSTGTLTVNDCWLAGNAATGTGGAIESIGALTVTNSTLSSNSTLGQFGSGGAIASHGYVRITNSTLTGNSALHRAGAISSYGPLNITNSTIANNRAKYGSVGGIGHFDGSTSITLRNTILAKNTDNGTAPDLYPGKGATVTITHSLIGDDTGAGLTAAPVGSPDTNGNLIGTGIAMIDPRLGALAYNGGPTQTLALLAGSPAIDSGKNSLATNPGNGNLALATDERGATFVRISGAAVDMGAFEAQPLSLLVSSASDHLDETFDPAQLTLRDAVVLADNNPGPDTISFASALDGISIDMTLGQFAISDAVTITGNGAANTIINAQQSSRIFDIAGSAGNVTLDGMTLENGETTADSEPGGAIRSSSTGMLTVRNSTLSGNSTSGQIAAGGAIYLGNGPLTLSNSTLSGNSATGPSSDGGAISAVGGAVNITNSTLYRNSASLHGGAIFSFGAVMTITNSTIAHNHASAFGGGLFANAVILRNSILAQNIDGGTAPDLDRPGANTLTVTHSLIGNNTGTTLIAAPVGSPDANGNLIGTGTAPIDPKLGTLAGHGGQTQTMALLAGSPAFGAGSNALATDPGPDGIAGTADDVPLLNDERGAGFVRIVRTVDIGAYEVQALATPTVNFLATSNHSPVLTGTYDQQTANVLQVTVNGTTFTLGTSPQLVSDHHGNWTVTTTAAIPDGTYNVSVHTTDGFGDAAYDTTTVDLIVNSVAPAVTQFAGEYSVAAQGSNMLTLASIMQIGTLLTLNGSTTASATVTNPTQLQIGGVNAAYGDSQIKFALTGKFANQVWTKLDLPANYTNSRGAATHINQNGASLTFVDSVGGTSPGHWISPTQVFADAWNESATTDIGRLLWQDGSIWSENLDFQGTKNGSGTTTIAAAPSQVYVFDFVNAANKPVHLVQTGTANVIFIDSMGHMSLGTFSNPTQASTPYYPNDIATISLNAATVTWQDGSVWTQTAATTAITVTNYTNAAGVAVHLIQNGTSQLAFVDSLGRTSLGTLTSPTTALTDLYPGDFATISGNTVSWQDGSLWTQTNVVPLTITFFDTNGAITHVKLTSPTTLIGLDRELQGLTATRLNGKLFWSNGAVWDNFDFNTLNAFLEMGMGYP